MKKMSLIETLIESAKEMNFSKATIDKLEALAIPKVKELTSKEIKALRERTKASQAVFAKLLNVNPSTVQKWERGEVKPQNAALKLLHVLKRHGVEALKD